MKSPSLFVASMLLLFAANSDAYEVQTHDAITEKAIERSRIGTALESLGISEYRTLAVDPPPIAGLDSATAKEWIIHGSVLEDGHFPCDPRPSNHFFNPLNGEGLSRFGASLGNPSLDWGLEEPHEYSDQTFSLRDAREYLWQSLTEPMASVRMGRLANLFRSVGQVVHLVEDLAQPQHTRNDAHAGLRCGFGLFGFGSAYEKYSLAAVQELGFDFGSYPIVDRARFAEFWTDSDGSGLADFSNRSFVTHGTNFRGVSADFAADPRFPQPGRLDSFVRRENASALVPGAEGVVDFIANTIRDELTGETFVNPRASTYGLLDDDLRRRGLTARFSLNRFNHAEAVRILVPRAVGYAAGLIDHFFRGTIEIQPPTTYLYSAAPYQGGQGTFERLRARIRNSTEGEHAGFGTLVAVVRYRTSTENLHEQPDAELSAEESYAISAEQTVELGAALAEVTFDFSATPIPNNVADVHLTVAFRGLLTNDVGETEDAILLGGKDLYEPHRIRVVNSTDYACRAITLYDTTTMAPEDRDVNGDGHDDILGPFFDRSTYVSVNGVDGTGPGVPYSWRNHFGIVDVAHAQYGSFVILQDASRFAVQTYGFSRDTYTGDPWDFHCTYEWPAQVNRIVHTAAGSVREVSLLASSHRGSLGIDGHLAHHFHYWDDWFGHCERARAAAAPEIAEKEGIVNAFAESTL